MRGVRRRIGSRPLLVALILAVIASTALSASAGSVSIRASAITSVAFHGNMGAPIIDIRGHGFGHQPVADPPRPPEPPYASHYLAGGSGCTTTRPPVGYDYGTSLYIASSGLSAGRYRPNLQPHHELDCVGLVIVRYTPTRITFKLGSDYAAHHYQLAEGDPYEVGVHTLRFHGRVHYTP